MRKLLTLLIFSCNTKKQDYLFKPSDTTITTIIFMPPLEWANSGINTSEGHTIVAWRITKDSLMFDSSNAVSKRWQRDTSYIIQVGIPKKDSLGKLVLDSLKNPVIQELFPTVDKKYILQDFNRNTNKP